MKTGQTIIYKCKKCGRTIEDLENAKMEPDWFVPPLMPIVTRVHILLEIYKHRKQVKYNKEYGTENVRYRFGICNDCLKRKTQSSHR